MKRIITHFILPVATLICVAAEFSIAQNAPANASTGTLETLIVTSGTVAMDLDLNQLNGAASAKSAATTTLNFQTLTDSFFPVLVFNGELRGPKPGAIALVTTDVAALPAQLNAALQRLVVEKGDSGQPYDLAVRDGKTGFVYFTIEGHHYDYDTKTNVLRVTEGRLLVSGDFAKNMGRPADAGAQAGTISITANMRPIEVDQVVNGEVKSSVLPASSAQPEAGTVPGPDVIVGDIIGLQQGGSSGSFVGLGVGTTSCNIGVVELNWFAMPNTDHPVIPQNLYRMSGGTDNAERFEQIGQSWLKHAFTALQNNACNLGCVSSGTGTRLGSGCSDPYSASLNYSQSGLGARAWVNPFTGAYPTTARDHSGHGETGISHRVVVAMSDLATTSNPGATYFAEGQYVTPHEYAWCQSHPGECNMYNNVSYRQYTPSGTTSFTFAPVSATVRQKPGIAAWTGATIVPIEPAPGVDGIGSVAYKVTNPSAGVWHYEYVVYNQTLDRAIQSFSVPMGCGVSVSNTGFRAPQNEAGVVNDGTGGAGISNAVWSPVQNSTALRWSSQTFAQNPNANAIRWGTLFNFRFDSNRPPAAANATVGFFKTGAPMTVAIQAPSPGTCAPLTVATAVSRKTHGAAGNFDINLPLSGEPGIECRNGGASNAHTLVFTFSNNIVSGNVAVTEGTATAASPVISGNTITVNLSDVSNLQKVTVNLTGVTDEFDQTLAPTTVSMNMLLGDVVGNKTVNGSDVGMTKASTSVPVDLTNFRADVIVSGVVNGSDIGQVKATVGSTLP